MKLRNLTFIIVSISLMLSACGDLGGLLDGEATPPEGVLPSAEFNPNNLPDEPFADDAIKVTTEDGNAPFRSLELMPDGHYLLSTSDSYDSYSSIKVSSKSGKGFTVRKVSGTESPRTKAIADENGTIDFGDYKYGRYTKVSAKEFLLSCGIYVNFQNLPDNGEIMYYSQKSELHYCRANKVERPETPATNSICRAWDYNSFEIWGYMNGKYIAHGKQTLVNGDVNTTFNVIPGLDLEKEDFLDEEEYMCKKVIFTSYGTYLCFYVDGDAELDFWEWTDERNGIFTYYLSDNPEDDWTGDLTVRFAGNQARFYEEYNESEVGMTFQTFVVHTLTAAN